MWHFSSKSLNTISLQRILEKFYSHDNVNNRIEKKIIDRIKIK
jgi:hypothetical protein